MLIPLRPSVWAAAVALALSVAGAPLDGSEWRYSSPILSPQGRGLGQAEADRLLARFCETPVHTVAGVGPTCTTRRLDAGFSGIVDHTFHPKAVTFGHFLAPESDAAAVSGSSAESHPYRWGGTLLLSKLGGTWIPVWYRSGMIVDSCEKFALPDGREMLLCEDEDAGMGHELHDLYTIDFQHPSDLSHTLVASADSIEDSCVSQKQALTGFHWRVDRQGFSVEVDTTEWNLLHEPYCANYTKRSPASIRMTFRVTRDGLHKVEPESAEEP